MQIAIFGGSFDPVHHGHLILAEWCLSHLKLDQVLFIPNRYHPFPEKAQLSEASQRWEMLRLAIQPYDLFFADDREMKREAVSYTVDTLREIHSENPGTQLTYLLGEDNLAGFHRWKEPGHICNMAKIAVFKRSGMRLQNNIEGYEFQRLENPLIEISSTMIRERVKKGLPIRSLVPPEVHQYIMDNNLYSAR